MIRHRLEIVICVVLVAVTLAIFWPVRNHEFVDFDDSRYVSENLHVAKGLTWDGIGWAFTTTYAEFWHPVTWLSHMLDYQMFGDNPSGHHLTNLVLHLANTVLLFLVLKSMTQARWPSAFVAALFALHPLHVESVVWVAERKDLLSILFWLLTLHAYFHYVRRQSLARYVLVALFFSLGLMAKPMLVTLPFVMLLLDYWPLGRLTGQRSQDTTSFENNKSEISHGRKTQAVRVILEKVPLIVLAGIFSVVALVAQHKGGGLSAVGDFTFGVRAANALVSYWKYMGMTIWPLGLAPFYPFFGEMPPLWQWGAAACLLALVSVLVIRLRAKYPYLPVGWFWYLGTLLPVIGLVQIGDHAMADRYTYVTIPGLFIMIAWGIPELLKTVPYRNMMLGTTAVVLLAACAIMTYRQVGYWQNTITLFEHTLDVTKDNWKAHNNLGLALADQGKLDEAVVHYQEALKIRPNDPDVFTNLGVALAGQQRFEEAVAFYHKALQYRPTDGKALGNLGVTLAKQGRLDEAIALYGKALETMPDDADIHYNLASALALKGKVNDAVSHFSQGLRIKPNAKAHYNLGVLLAQLGRYQEAMAHFSEALRLKPDYAEARFNLKALQQR